jgi:predicted GIY-YIG superfamily endonuclease
LNTALYRFYDKTGNLLYVGISDNLGTRFYNHARKKPWWPQVATANVEWFDTRAKAAKAERKAIRSEHPLWNIVHKGRPRRSARVKPSPTREPSFVPSPEDAKLFRVYRRARKEANELLPQVREFAAQALKDGATVGQLSKWTGLTDEVFRRIARAEGVERLRPPTVGREVERADE